MTKDEALIYWVMRFGTTTGVDSEYIRNNDAEHDVFEILTPMSNRPWPLYFSSDGWKISELGLQRLKEISNVEPS